MPLSQNVRPRAMTRDDSASALAYQHYVEQTFGPRLPLQDIRATTAFDSTERFAGSRTPDSVVAVLVGSIAPPPWLVRSAKTNEDSVRAMLRSLEVVRIPRSGHLIFLLSPDAAERAMRRFLDRIAP